MAENGHFESIGGNEFQQVSTFYSPNFDDGSTWYKLKNLNWKNLGNKTRFHPWE